MTIRDLVRKSVEGLRREFLSENDRNRLVEYILDNSNLVVLNNRIELRSYNLFGVGEDNKDKDLPCEVEYVLFSWGKQDDYDDNHLGLKSKWQLESFSTFMELEDTLSNGFGDTKSEKVVLIYGNLQQYKLKQNYNMFGKMDIYWENIKPYRLSYRLDSESRVELFNSKEKIEERVIELYKDNEEHLKDTDSYIRIEDIFDDEQYGFVLSGGSITVNTDGIMDVSEPVFMWCDYCMF